MERNDRLRTWFLSVFVILAVGCGVLYSGARREEGKRASFARQNGEAEDFQTHRPPDRAPLFQVTEEELLRAAESAAGSGVRITEIKRLAPEAQEHGEILKLRVTGEGAFSEVTEVLDRLHGERPWMAVALRRLERSGGTLYFTIELQAYRGHGAGQAERQASPRGEAGAADG